MPISLTFIVIWALVLLVLFMWNRFFGVAWLALSLAACFLAASHPVNEVSETKAAIVGPVATTLESLIDGAAKIAQ